MEKNTRAWYQKVQSYLIGLPVIWILSISLIVIIKITFYNNYLPKTYLKGNLMTTATAFRIISDNYYITVLISGFIGITILVFVGVSSVIQGLKGADNDSRFFWIAVFGPLINLILLIILLVVYSSPILIAFAMVIGISGVFLAREEVY